MRTWVYQTLRASAIFPELKGGLHGPSSLREVPADKPYAYYRMGISAGLLHSSGPAYRTPVELFVHDVPGDYERIETLLEYAKIDLLREPPLVPEPRLICCEFVQYSQDIPEDHLTGTISKVARFSLVHK